MGDIGVFFLSLVIFCDKASSVNTKNLNRSDYIKPDRLDHRKISGRWYLYMDTRDTDVRDNTFGDFDVLGNGKLVNNLYRWFPDLEECRTTALSFDPISSDPETAVKFRVTRRSTNETLGMQTFLYIDDHPTEGFLIMHQETHMDTYLITTRQRDPSNLDDDIEAALLELDLDPQNFRVKSTNYGCERNREHGLEL